MNTPSHSRSAVLRIRAATLAFTCGLTFMSSGASAIEIPNVPLESGAQYPPPNVMFILDDSTSMERDYMPDTVPSVSPVNIASQTYARNAVYYNPAVTYEPWIKADGTRFTQGLSYTAALTHNHIIPSSGGTTNLSDSVRTFYVPKAGALDLASTESYYRYQITTGSPGDIIRSEYGTANNSNRCPGMSGSPTWKNCTSTTATPSARPNTSRTLAQEKANFATWYSYHRTRMKVAKAGASEAFQGLPSNLRIGFANIHADANSRMDIPVDNDGGLFRGDNKAEWFKYLHGENLESGTWYTPLRTGLADIGEYFKSTSADGPWGPESGEDQLACRQNFAILTTDGFWNKQDEDIAPSAAQTALSNIGNEDGTPEPNGYVATAPYADNHSKTLADVAMYYWKNDLRPDLDNKVPTSSADNANWQHMSTFAISIGLEGSISPRTPRTTRSGSSGWPNPDPGTGTGKIEGIDDLWHASVNGRGSFIVANNAREFQRGLLDAFSLVAERTGSASNVTANSTSITSETRVFQATYVSGKWSGNLLSYPATSSGLGGSSWSAAALIGSTTRNFFTWDTGRKRGATFPTTGGGASSNQQSDLDQSARAIAPVSAANNVAYLKGTRTLERQNGGTLRDRASPLGDIVNSSPAYSKDTDTIFVGANDGMLHAFNASTGRELFAYVPGNMDIAALGDLSNPNYQHRYFVDGPISVSSRDVGDGRNILVGALGRGGKTLYALDVTTPASFAASDVLWELTDDDLGNVLGEPLLTMTNDGKSVAIISNGINSKNGSSVLFVIDLETGDVLHELDTGVAGDNGLFDPRGFDIDRNLTVDYVYAGDRLGNLWKFDFTKETPTIAHSGKPMFTTDTGQPITSGLALGTDPKTKKRWVFFATGSYLTVDDLTDTTIQSVYGIIDEDEVVSMDDLVSRDIIFVGTTVPGAEVRTFEPVGTLDADEKGWRLDLDNPDKGERVINRPQLRPGVLVFSSRVPPEEATGCDAGGSGWVNALSPFAGNSTEKPWFMLDVDGDGKFDDEKEGFIFDYEGEEVWVPVGSVRALNKTMLTQCAILDGIMVCGDSGGGITPIPINPPAGAPKRASWHEVLGD
jgi:type IV pilus assembly protein PilY1